METTRIPPRSLPVTTLEVFLARCATLSRIQRRKRFLQRIHDKALLLSSVRQTLSPLLALPVELKLHIISRIPHDRYLTLACLHWTHSSFISLISKARVRSKLSRLALCDQLLTTENHYEHLLPPNHYYCYVCPRLLPEEAFPFHLEHDFAIFEDPPYHWPQYCKQCVARDVIHRVVHVDLLCGGILVPPSTPVPQDCGEDSEGGIKAGSQAAGVRSGHEFCG